MVDEETNEKQFPESIDLFALLLSICFCVLMTALVLLYIFRPHCVNLFVSKGEAISKQMKVSLACLVVVMWFSNVVVPFFPTIPLSSVVGVIIFCFLMIPPSQDWSDVNSNFSNLSILSSVEH